MERKEYRAQKTERSVRIYGSAAGCLSAADLTAGTFWLDPVQSAVVDLPWHGGVTTLALSAAAVGASFWTRQRRSSLQYQRTQALHAREWAGRRDRRKTIGLAAARSSARNSRPDWKLRDRVRAHATEVGIPLGRTVSGPRSARGHRAVLSWEEGGALVLGEPGSRKSTFLAGVVTGAPGTQVVVSTKDEFLTGTWEARAARGPVLAFCPLNWDVLPEGVAPLRWSLVLGCSVPQVAQKRAHALMSATESAGLANSGFWQSKGRAVLSALLCAADLQGTGLRTLARWLQEERYTEAAETLERHPGQVEPSMVATLRQMTGNGDRTASSVSHTASAVLEFLQDGRIAQALDAPREEALDLAAFVRANSTLYMVTDNSPSLGPVVSAIWDSIVDAAKVVAVQQRMDKRTPRLRRPLLLTVDEMDKTMPAVPLDDHAAELRGWGIFVLGATQNRSRLVKAWGEQGADALCNSLQVHVILSMNSGKDREYYEKRIGTRTVEHMKISESAPSTMRERMFGNPAKSGHSQSASVDPQTVPLWEASMWSYLERGHALIIPTRGAPAVVDIGNGWRLASAAGTKARAEAAAEAWQHDAAREAAAREAAQPEGAARTSEEHA